GTGGPSRVMGSQSLAEELVHAGSLPGRSELWERIRRETEAVAVAGLPVLLSGEQGTGRLHVARHLHARWCRGGPLTVLDALLADAEIGAHLPAEEIDRALDPRGYLGSADAFIDRALERYEAAP
ncbi:MAG: hypothetical protein GEU88_17965, partial [Solirubrobacterales bacterium]|nr:hypothetical protein [Solirubrobacterales bacterium]